MTIFVKPIVNTKLHLKRNKYNEGRGIDPLPFIFAFSPYTSFDNYAYFVNPSGDVDRYDLGDGSVYGDSYGRLTR